MKGRKRSILITILCSIFFPGLGQMYNGRLKLGIILNSSFMFTTFILTEIGLSNSFMGIIVLLILALLFYLFVLIHSVKLALASADFTFKKYNIPVYYILWILIACFGSGYIKDIYRIKAYRIPSSAMEPTLLVGDHIYVDKRISYKDIKSGDIVVFEYPQEPNIHYIKRCIATEGKEVEIVDKKVFIDKILLNDSTYTQHKDNSILGRWEGRFLFSTYNNNQYGSRDNFGPIKVPENQMFVLGDNRDRSSDSRVWGFVPGENIIGKVKYIYFSDDRDYRFYEISKYIRFSRIGKKIE